MDAHNPILAATLARRCAELAQQAHVLQLRRIEHLMRAMHRLANAGFVIEGFSARDAEPTTLYVAVPDDELVDRVAGNAAKGGTFNGRRGSQLWFSFDGLRVAWDVVPEEPLPEVNWDLLQVQRSRI
jgi:hypothetical protein